MRKVNPIGHFSLWLRVAITHCPGTWFDPTSVTLATSGKNGYVTARMVLLKKFGREGFTFYTNYASRKGQQLSKNPRAALVFHWPYLRRQVRVEGRVERISEEESEKYFHSRPRLYQLAAAASKQSEKIPSRKFLIDRFQHLQKSLAGRSIPLPRTWGGYLLIPDMIEFWQHRNNRLHDRLQYRKHGNGKWTVARLAP